MSGMMLMDQGVEDVEFIAALVVIIGGSRPVVEKTEGRPATSRSWPHEPRERVRAKNMAIFRTVIWVCICEHMHM